MNANRYNDELYFNIKGSLIVATSKGTKYQLNNSNACSDLHSRSLSSCAKITIAPKLVLYVVWYLTTYRLHQSSHDDVTTHRFTCNELHVVGGPWCK